MESKENVNEEKIKNIKEEQKRLQNEIKDHYSRLEQWLKDLSNSVDKLTEEIHKLNQHYVTRNEYDKDMEIIYNRFEKLFKRLWTSLITIICLLLTSLSTVVWEWIKTGL